MRTILSTICAAVLATLCSCTPQQVPIQIIFDTDLGNDVDDAIAMDMLYKYADEGKIEILAEGISKDGVPAAEYLDLLNNWYGYAEVPMGIILNGSDPETQARCYTEHVSDLTLEDGTPMFKKTEGLDYSALPQTHILYRKVLSQSEDRSVTLVTVGFSTNLARLLDTPADEYSSLDGKELVAAKVKNLVMMAGRFDDPEYVEFNILKDVPAARKVVSEWPTPIVFAPFELGLQVCYPATSIENDFGWTENHPVVEAYKVYTTMPYDRPCWDPAALVYAVEGDKWFGVSAPGKIVISERGTTSFEESPTGTHTYLTVTPEQAVALKNHIVEVVSASPFLKENNK